jgi:CSLREA domain-containing protein
MLLVLLSAAPAGAATFTVTTTTDAPDAGLDGACAIAGGGCSLRAAFQEANSTADPDVIVIPPGRFRITRPGEDEENALTGDFDSTQTLTIQGAGAGRTILDGNGADRVLEERDHDLTVEGVTITGGLLAGDGAGIEQDAGALVVRDSAIVDNTGDPSALPSGGGIDASGATALVERSLIARNHAYNGGAIDGGAEITIRSSTLAHNTAGTLDHNGDGGALDTTATILDSTIVGNIAWNGAGSPGGIRDATLRNTVLAGNLSFNQGSPTDPGVPDNCSGTFTSEGGNVSDDATCALAGPGDRNELDPQLSDLSDHGGPFESIVPLSGSPLIDTGAGCDPLDMRGQSRPCGAGCDVGAIETSLPHERPDGQDDPAATTLRPSAV